MTILKAIFLLVASFGFFSLTRHTYMKTLDRFAELCIAFILGVNGITCLIEVVNLLK